MTPSFSWFRLVVPSQTRKRSVPLLVSLWSRVAVPGQTRKFLVSFSRSPPLIVYWMNYGVSVSFPVLHYVFGTSWETRIFP